MLLILIAISHQSLPKKMLNLTNAYRSDKCLSELKEHRSLVRAAQSQADMMCLFNRFMGKDEKELSNNLLKYDYVGQNIGENTAREQGDDYKEVFRIWKEHDDYNKNLLGDYENVGIGTCLSEDGKRYWVQLFGKKASRGKEKSSEVMSKSCDDRIIILLNATDKNGNVESSVTFSRVDFEKSDSINSSKNSFNDETSTKLNENKNIDIGESFNNEKSSIESISQSQINISEKVLAANNLTLTENNINNSKFNEKSYSSEIDDYKSASESFRNTSKDNQKRSLHDQYYKIEKNLNNTENSIKLPEKSIISLEDIMDPTNTTNSSNDKNTEISISGIIPKSMIESKTKSCSNNLTSLLDSSTKSIESNPDIESLISDGLNKLKKELLDKLMKMSNNTSSKNISSLQNSISKIIDKMGSSIIEIPSLTYDNLNVSSSISSSKIKSCDSKSDISCKNNEKSSSELNSSELPIILSLKQPETDQIKSQSLFTTMLDILSDDSANDKKIILPTIKKEILDKIKDICSDDLSCSSYLSSHFSTINGSVLDEKPSSGTKSNESSTSESISKELFLKESVSKIESQSTSEPNSKESTSKIESVSTKEPSSHYSSKDKRHTQLIIADIEGKIVNYDKSNISNVVDKRNLKENKNEQIENTIRDLRKILNSRNLNEQNIKIIVADDKCQDESRAEVGESLHLGD